MFGTIKQKRSSQIKSLANERKEGYDGDIEIRQSLKDGKKNMQNYSKHEKPVLIH